jgi:hypothetical protein
MKKALLYFFILILTGQFIQAQQKVYMPFFEVLNIANDYQYSLSKLFQGYVRDQGKYEILLPAWNNDQYPKESQDETQSRARELGAPFFIKGDLNALGDLIIVTMSMFQTDNGQEIWNSLLKANKLDDLDPILITFAKNLGEKEVTTTGNNIYTVTDQEGKELTEIETKISTGLLLGGAYPFGGTFSPGLGWLTTYDNRNVIYGLDFSVFFHEGNSLGYIDITADYPFTPTKNTGFAGGGLGYGWVSVYNDTDPMSEENDVKSGLMLLAGGGVILNRTSSVRLIIGSRIFVPLFEVDNKFYPGINFFVAVNISKRAKRHRQVDVNVNE